VVLDLGPHLLRCELLAAAGAGRAHHEGWAAGDADIAGLLGRDPECHRRVPIRCPVTEEDAIDAVARSARSK
jgi:hypothetical protein